MVLVLHGGPHSDCHFQVERDDPPSEVRLRGPDLGTTAVYTLTDWQGEMWVYGRCEVTHDVPPRLVRFIE